MRELALTLLLFAGPPAVLVALLGVGVRRARDWQRRAVWWSVLVVAALFCWLVMIPATRRTNDPVGEGLVLHFLIRWGPPLGALWLALQELLAARERSRAARGFAVLRRRDE